MSIRGWWERMRGARRKTLLAKRRRRGLASDMRALPRPVIASPDDPISARVDLVRFAAFAEAAAESMESGPIEFARMRFDEACLYFARAMEAAKRAGLSQEIARLKLRMSSVRRAFDTLRRTSLRPELRNPSPKDRRPEF